ncbi:hypothetical protein SAMN05444716_101302 [Streptomyces harbinensis]|uniref:DUF5753 domain-containing protein n=1 Tax=Streptomyces harbinensis TaxID=1176198 RepID=A0A1I6P6B0_9ACTN|nr:hypothetical protein SAMN05444716_101302 [Streptomyces harbinensis]
MRMRRPSSCLAGDQPATLTAILDEAVLRRIIGSPAVTAKQLGKLRSASEQPITTVQLLPFSLERSKDPNVRLLLMPRAAFRAFVAEFLADRSHCLFRQPTRRFGCRRASPKPDDPLRPTAPLSGST